MSSISSTGRIDWVTTWSFILIHLAPFGLIWSGVTWQSVVCCVVLYLVRMFGITAGFHRYFSHRAFKTSRFFQFMLACLAQSSAQRGVLWLAANHRHHHKYSDTGEDIHSPVTRSFWFSHMGWVFSQSAHDVKEPLIRDFLKYPELRWLNRYYNVPAFFLALFTLILWGLPGLLMSFMMSTVLVWHGTFTINSLSHVYGSRRYDTGDESRNNFWLALITLGEGWHNNHHALPRSARHGLSWSEIDFCWMQIRLLERLGLAWDVQVPTESQITSKVELAAKRVA